jgi:hypothetical protein
MDQDDFDDDRELPDGDLGLQLFVILIAAGIVIGIPVVYFIFG